MPQSNGSTSSNVHVGDTLMPPSRHLSPSISRSSIPPPLPPRSPRLTNSSNMSRSDSPNPPEDERSPSDLPLDEDAAQVSNEDDHEMTEQQLRELYDTEEIERFIHLFSAYVTEVRLPATPEEVNESYMMPDAEDSEYHSSYLDDGGWIPVTKSSESLVTESPPTRSFSEEIAFRYIVPNLPPAHPTLPPFTIGRLRLAIQRLYLAIRPVYVPFLARLIDLALWKDQNRSLFYCVTFWSLWWFNFLLPTLFLRILYSILRRRIFPYPSLEDLREHREEVVRANEFGDKISARLSAASTFGVKEMWRLFKVFNKSKKNKAKAKGKEKINSKGKDTLSQEEIDEEIDNLQEDSTILDDVQESEETKDMKRTGLQVLTEIADLHERVRNMFIWRRPASSRVYAMLLFFLFILTAFVPARYLAKIIYFIGGFFFWHVIPVIAALPSSERLKLPSAFADVPTDAEYAMELISQRVAAGLPVTPPRRNGKHGKARQHSRYQTSDLAGSSSTDNLSINSEMHARSPSQDSSNVDWQKWGERVAFGKALATSGKRLLSAKSNESSLSDHRFLPPAPAVGPDVNPETHTFPAQHSSSPGIVTITSTTFFFTPLTAQNAKLVIPLTFIKGVKKIGMLKGLTINWNDVSSDGTKVQKDEKFLWVGGRDELFARLVSIQDGRRWMNV